MKIIFNNIDEHIKVLTPENKIVLQKLRDTTQKLVPKASETESYGMSAFKYNNKILVYFIGWQNHIGFYPSGNTIKILETKL